MVALLVVSFFVVALIVDALVRRAQKVEPAKVYASINGRRAPSYPRGYFLTPGHLWVNLRPSGKVLLGIDELISRLIGKNSTIQMERKPGETVHKGDVIATLTQKDKTIHIPSPIEGIVEQSNLELEDSPYEFAEKPYTKGWFYIVKPTNLSADLKGFAVADQTESWWSKELNRLREFVQVRLSQPALAGLTVQDGGFPLDGLAEHFDQKTVEELELNFLNYRK